MSRKRFYFVYIGLGLLYLIIKLIFVSAGYLHVGAIFHGLVPAVLMAVAGIWGLQGLKAGNPGRGLKFILVIMPILVFVVTPPFMYFKQGSEWLTQGRLPVLIFYEVLAVVQCVYAVKNLRK